MALVGKDNFEKMWNFCKAHGLTDAGSAAVIGNGYAESGCSSINLQNNGNRNLGMTDEQYTAAVDNGTYTNFVHDGYGYGCFQWTFWSRKQNLLNYVKSRHVSIGDLEAQMEFFMQELNTGYKSLLNILRTSNSISECSNAMLLQFERPASVGKNATEQQRQDTCNKRASYAQEYYDRFHKEIIANDKFTLADFISLYNQMRKDLQDNNSSQYSEIARNWAIENGLIAGNGTLINGEPNYMWRDILTREQFVTVMYRFAQMLKKG